MSEKIEIICRPDVSVVRRLLGQGQREAEQLKEIYETELRALRGLVKPCALVRQLLTDGELLAACGFAASTPVLAVLLTLGSAGGRYVEELFGRGEHLRGLVADAVQSAWLFAADGRLQEDIRERCRKRGIGVAGRLEAPQDLPASAQKMICDRLDAETLAGVRVNDSHMLVPEKSVCYLLKLCGDSGQFAAGHDCEKCGKKDCGMRKEMQELIDIVVEDRGKKFTCEKGAVLMDALRAQGISIAAPCGGTGRCGKCRVRVISGELPVTAADRSLLAERELADGVRLACTARPQESLRIRLLQKPQRRIAAETGIASADMPGGTKNPADVCAKATAKNPADVCAKATAQNPADVCAKATAQNPAGVCAKATAKNPAGLPGVPADTRAAGPDAEGYGIAVDIGTTTLAACLYGFGSGYVYGTVTAVNSGRDFGADVLTRMEASNNGKRSRLQELLQEDLRELLAKLLEQTGAAADTVQKIVLAANMTMVHLLMGYSCKTLGRAPFVPVNKKYIRADALRLLGDTGFSCPVEILPAVSAFVGGDIVAGMLAWKLDAGEETALLLDVGTNGEMALRHQGSIWVASAAAGPAFEGGGISSGCASVPGAISGVHISDQDFRPKLVTIEDAPVAGICGSGVLELAGELLRTGLMDETGLLAEKYREGGFLLGRTPEGERVSFTQADIRNLQLAKGAIRAGIGILLKRAGICARDVLHIYLAGGFGVRMDETAAIRTGLLPREFAGRMKAVGNSSLAGAVLAGREECAGERLEALLAQCREVVLAGEPEFEACYVEQMNFG